MRNSVHSPLEESESQWFVGQSPHEPLISGALGQFGAHEEQFTPLRENRTARNLTPTTTSNSLLGLIFEEKIMGQLVDEAVAAVSSQSRDDRTARDKNTDILLQAWREVQLARANKTSKRHSKEEIGTEAQKVTNE